MRKYKLDCAYVISKFEFHDELKSSLLDLIRDSNFESPKNIRAEVDITRTDWKYSSDMSRSWVQYLARPLMDQLLPMYQELGFDGFKINEIWYQQYSKTSQHGWHTHSSNFTNVYYLDLPKDSPKTKLVNGYNQSEVIELDVEEGDMVIFPSFIIHSAPPNLSNHQKTIISYNVDATYSENIYGKGIKENHAVF